MPPFAFDTLSSTTHRALVLPHNSDRELFLVVKAHALRLACIVGAERVVQAVLSETPVQAGRVDERAMVASSSFFGTSTPLMYASQYNRITVARTLLDAGASAGHDRQTSAVHVAAQYGHLYMLKLLLDRDPKLASYVDEAHKYPIDLARQNGHIECETELSQLES